MTEPPRIGPFRAWLWTDPESGHFVFDLDRAPEDLAGLDEEGNLWVDEKVYEAMYGKEGSGF